MRRTAILAVLVAGAVFACGASARALHWGVSVVIQGSGSVKGCSNATNSNGRSESDCIDCHLQAPGDMEGCATSIPMSGPPENGGEITLVAIPDPGQVFGGWGGECSGTGNCSLDADGPHSVSASFTGAPPPPPPKFNLTVTKTGSGTGYVGGGGGIDCGPVCGAPEVAGTTLQLLAAADPGSTFAGWSGACTGTSPCTVTMTAAASLTATFERLPLTLHALSSLGVRGQLAKLRYTLANANSGHREGLIVLEGKRTLTQIPQAHTHLTGDIYFISWRVPATLRPGSLTFCITANDPASNQKARSCAPLPIK